MERDKIKNLSIDLKPKKVIIRKNIFKIGFIITGLLSIIIIVSLVVADSLGTFTVKINNSLNNSIVLSNDRDFKITTRELNLPAMNLSNSDHITYVNEINYDLTFKYPQFDNTYIDQVRANEGFYRQRKEIYAYTFFIKNNGKELVDLIFRLDILDNKNKMAEAIRVLLIYSSVEDYNDEEAISILYGRDDDIQDRDLELFGEYPMETKLYKKHNVILDEEIKGFDVNDGLKVSILIWMEGRDPETVDDLHWGNAAIKLAFNIYVKKEEEN